MDRTPGLRLGWFSKVPDGRANRGFPGSRATRVDSKLQCEKETGQPQIYFDFPARLNITLDR
jgi:hypothetical protein